MRVIDYRTDDHSLEWGFESIGVMRMGFRDTCKVKWMALNKSDIKDKLAMEVSESRRVKNYVQDFTWSVHWMMTSFETENTS